MYKYRKGQVSVEFLATYGWVLIVLLIALGILMNYGLLSPSKYLPDKADFGNQLKVEEYFLDYDPKGDGSDFSVLGIKLRNNFAREINITSMRFKKESNQYEDCQIFEINVTVGEDVLLACPDIKPDRNVKNKYYLEIQFKRNQAGAPEHKITGIIFTEPIKGNYCSLMENAEYLYNLDNNHITTDFICT